MEETAPPLPPPPPPPQFFTTNIILYALVHRESFLQCVNCMCDHDLFFLQRMGIDTPVADPEF